MTELFLSIGEAMVEMAPDGRGGYRLGFAGDTFNTAWYARRLLPGTWRVAYLSAAGTDAISDRMASFMETAGVETVWLRRLADRTVGLYLIDLADGERRFTYWRSDSAARRLAEDGAVLCDALARAKIAYFSGISLAILPDADRERLLAALAAARKAGTIVAFDPNIRPRLWPEAETMRASIMAAAGVSDIVLPSFEDEAAHFGDPSPEASARRYAAAGASTVIVKDGARPVVALVVNELTRHPVMPSQDVVDTTAAGDSFNAGFLAARLAGSEIADAVEAGSTIASAVVGERGALVAVQKPPIAEGSY